jgi:hypothetical protein
MRKEKAPVTGREDCSAGTGNSTATRQHQSRAMQRAALLQWLQAHERITTLQARNELGIMHPAARIQELREAGHNIATYWQWGTDATGRQHKQGLYVLLSGGDV